MLKKFKHHKLFFTFLFIFGTPIFFIGILKLYYFILPGKEIGSVGDWISFSGGYVGAILALGGIWWQINHSKLEKQSEVDNEYKNIIIYIHHLLVYNLNELNESKENLKFSYTFHRAFVDKDSLLKYRQISIPIIDKHSPHFLKNNHSCILDIFYLIFKVEAALEVAIDNSEIKKIKLKKIIEEQEKLKKRIEIEENKIAEDKNKSFKYLLHLKEQQMVLNNFISCSYLTISPNSNSLLEFKEDGKYYFGFPTSKTLTSNIIFENYTAKNSYKRRILSNDSFFNLYLEYYKELYLVFSVPGYLPNNDELEFCNSNSDLAMEINRLYVLDEKRKELLENYEKTLITSIEILLNFIEK